MKIFSLQESFTMVKNEDNSTDSETEQDRNDEKGTSGCPHLIKSVDPTKLRKTLKSPNALAKSCSECIKLDLPKPEEGFSVDETLWLCLRCGVQLCGRFQNKHALSHFEVSEIFFTLNNLELNKINFEFHF